MLKLVQYDVDVINEFPESLRAIILMSLRNLTFSFNKTGFLGTLEQMYSYFRLQDSDISFDKFCETLISLKASNLIEVKEIDAGWQNEVSLFRITAV